MRRSGLKLRMLVGIATVVALAMPTFAQALWPVIALPPHVDLQPRDGQPLAAFRSGRSFAEAGTIANQRIRLKLFLTQASILDRVEGTDGIEKLPIVLTKVPPTNGSPEVLPPPIRVISERKEMPADVADAVKLLRPNVSAKREPDDTMQKQKLGEASDPATKAAVSQAIDILRGGTAGRPTAKSESKAPTLVLPKEFADPQRDAKLADVAKQIDALNESIVAPALLPMPSLAEPILSAPLFNVPTPATSDSPEPLTLVLTLEPIPAPNSSSTSRSGEEEQDAVKAAVDQAIAALMAQPPELPSSVPVAIPVVSMPRATASCPSCGRGSGLRPLHRLGDHKHSSEGGCATCGGGWRCHPGHEPCQPCEAHDGPLGRMFCDFYECLCCPDPCYEPTWRQVPNAALFVDGARPITQTEIRWDAGRGGNFPDRAEYFWARADGQGRGPRPPAGRIGEFHFDYDDLTIITETAKDKLSMIVEMPYRAVSPDFYAHGAGFGNMGIGTKTLLFDCELMQVSMQMKTYLPIGNALKGVGNGHVSLEPSLLFALKLHADTYVQAQISEWIPIGGDPFYAGSVLHTHTSLNHVLHRFGPDIPLVGTMEANTFSFQDGAYTDPVFGSFQKASDTTYISMGPGVRLFFCDKLDFGFGTAFSLTSDNFARQLYRTSVRLRF